MKHLKLGVELAGGVALLGLAAAQLDFPSKKFWDENGSVVAACFAAAFADLVFAFVYRRYLERSELLRHRQRDKVHVALSGLIVAAAAQFADLDAHEAGASVWIIRKRRRGFKCEERLERLHRVRLSAVPAASGLQWRKNRGVVGVAWGEQRVCTGSFRDVRDKTPAEWVALGNARTFGLTHDEFRRVRGYELVVAAPILEYEQVIGAVSFDVVFDSSRVRSLDHAWIEGATQTSANQVAGYLSAD